MLVEKLAFGVAVDADVGIETDDLAAPQLLFVQWQPCVACSTRDQILQRRLAPQPLSKGTVVNLEAVIDSHGIAFFGFPRCGSQRQGRQERNICPAQRRRPEIRDGDDVIWEHMVQCKVFFWDQRTQGGPIGWLLCRLRGCRRGFGGGARLGLLLGSHGGTEKGKASVVGHCVSR